MASSDDIIRIHGGDAFETLAEIAAKTDAKAVLKAAAAWERERDEDRSMSGDDAATLFAAVARMRGPFALRLESELNAYYRTAEGKPTKEGQDKHLAQCRDELRKLFQSDLHAVIVEARGL